MPSLWYRPTHKPGKASNGSQRYFCPQCQQPFNEQFDPLSYYCQVTPAQIRLVLQAHIASGNQSWKHSDALSPSFDALPILSYWLKSVWVAVKH